MLPVVTADAKKLGITFHALTIAGAFSTLQTTSKNIAIAMFPGWFKDHADPLPALRLPRGLPVSAV